jgi:hypothetical protein
MYFCETADDGGDPGHVDDVAHFGWAERAGDCDGRNHRHDGTDDVFQAVPTGVLGDDFGI